KMKPLKNSSMLIRSLLIIAFIIMLGCQSDAVGEVEALNPNSEQRIVTDDNGQDVIITKDLSTLFTTLKADSDTATKGCPAATSGEGFPINGCQDFTVGVSLAGWVYLETTVTVCCACAICGTAQMKSLENNELKGFKTVEVQSSSTVVFRDYEISIADGSYEVSEGGDILDLSYKVVVKR
ncbi:MAG: hypothetical protein AAF934_03865, partial [Bacteroidota bacterium]